MLPPGARGRFFGRARALHYHPGRMLPFRWTLALGAIALFAHVRPAEGKPAEPRSRVAESVGSPSSGRLVGGRRVEASRALKLVGSYAWGLPELAGMLERGAARVDKKHPGSVLAVADLSRKGGGEVGGHRSHESGRDADVGFYLSRKGKPYFSRRFHPIDDEGRAKRDSSLRFDDARNWSLIEAWLKDEQADVLQIYVADHLEKRLIAEAMRSGAPPALIQRARDVLFQPTRGLPHDNHFHLRIACPRTQKDCVNFSKAALTVLRPRPIQRPRAASLADSPGKPAELADRREPKATKKR